MSSRSTPRHRATTSRRLPRAVVGAVVVAVVGVLLLGGRGSFAYWTSARSVTAGSQTAGSIALSAPSCGSWQLIQTGGIVGGKPSPDPTAYTNQPLQPNDVLTLTCTSKLTLAGDHVAGTVQVDGEPANAPTSPLTLDGTTGRTDGSPGTTYPVMTITAASGPNAGVAQTRSTFAASDNGATVSVTFAISIPNSDQSNPTVDTSQQWASQLRLTAVQRHP